MPRFPALLASVFALSLLACQAAHDETGNEDDAARERLTTESATLGEEPAAMTAIDSACNADPVQALVGQRVSDALVAQALKDSGSSVSRVLAPNTPATLDLSHSRLNILTDDNGVIQSLHCG